MGFYYRVSGGLMKRVILIFFFVFCSAVTNADVIDRGEWIIRHQFIGLSQNLYPLNVSMDKGAVTFSLSPGIEYMMSDTFAVGGTLMIFKRGTKAVTLFSLGPSMHYYFYKSDNTAASLGTAFGFTTGGGTSKLDLGVNLSFDYFLSENVALGPVTNLNWNISNRNAQLMLLGAFKIIL